MLKFSIAHNKLKAIPYSLTFPDSIIKLDFSFNNISNIYELSLPRSLSEFNLCANKITEIPEDLELPSYLRVLDLGINRIKYFPEKWVLSEYLEILKLNNNKIKEIANDYEFPKFLSVLDLNNNKLEWFESKVPKEVTVYTHDNRIVSDNIIAGYLPERL